MLVPEDSLDSLIFELLCSTYMYVRFHPYGANFLGSVMTIHTTLHTVKGGRGSVAFQDSIPKL